MTVDHLFRFCASCLCIPRIFISAFTLSNQVFLPLPLALVPPTSNSLQSDTQSPLAFRSACPYHRNLPRLKTSSTHTTSKRSLRSASFILSLRETPHIHLTIVFSALSNRLTLFTFTAQVSLPYTKTLWTQALYIFPFNLRG